MLGDRLRGRTSWIHHVEGEAARLRAPVGGGAGCRHTGVGSRRLRPEGPLFLLEFPTLLYIHIYYILYDGGRCMRDVRARSGIYFDEHRAGSKEATTLCRLF